MGSTTFSTEFKRQLIMKVKEHPSIWTSKSDDNTSEYWIQIASELNFTFPYEELKTSWQDLRHVYYRKIFLKTIERNFEAPKWIHFHDMIFMYEYTKELIQSNLGGISPPLFKPKSIASGSQRILCPCCMNIDGDNPIQTEEDDVENFSGSDSTEQLSNCSFYLGDSSNQNSNSIILGQQEKSDNPLDQTYSIDLTEEQASEISKIMHSTEARNVSSKEQHQFDGLEKIKRGFSEFHKISNFMDDSEAKNGSLIAQQQLDTLASIKRGFSELITDNTQIKTMAIIRDARTLERTKLIQAVKAHPSLYDDTSPQAREKDAWEKVAKESGILLRHVRNRWKVLKSRYLKELIYLRYSRSPVPIWDGFYEMDFMFPYMQKDIEDIHRTRIEMSEAIKKRQNMEVSNVAKSLEPTSLPEDINRNANEKRTISVDSENKSNSSDSNSNQLLVPMPDSNSNQLLVPMPDSNSNQLLVPMPDSNSNQFLVSMPASNSNTPSLLTPDSSSRKLLVSTPVSLSNQLLISMPDSNSKSSKPDSSSRKLLVSKPDSNSNQLSSVSTVSTLKTYVRKPTKPIILDTKMFPMLQNRPIKITSVQMQPTLDFLENDDPSDKTTSMNLEDPSPAKKLRLSNGSEKNNTNKHANEQRESTTLLSPSVSNITLDLTVEENTLEKSAASEPSNLANQPLPQKVYPALDLTLDDDESEKIPAFKVNPISEFQQKYVSEFVNTNKVFPSLDLTADEDKHKDVNVIWLDTESVESYEEVVVFVSDDETNDEKEEEKEEVERQ